MQNPESKEVMTSIVICEKPSQARNIQAAVGNKYGPIYACAGHLIDLAMPEIVDAAWANWSYDLLMPPGGRYPLAAPEEAYKKKSLSAIGNALKDASQVIIATDCDREGQLIGDEVLQWFNYEGAVKRAIFTAEDKLSLSNAFGAAKPNSHYLNLSTSAESRRQSDQIFNLSLTRGATLSFKNGGRGAVGIGRVKTPTLAIVCRRELEISNFTAQDYFDISAHVETKPGSEEASGLSLKYAPGVAWRIRSGSVAEQLVSCIKDTNGTLIVKSEDKKTSPPKLLDLPAMQKKAGSWGWSAKKTLDIAQALYETHKIATYPRAETGYLPEVNSQFVARTLQGLAVIGAYRDLIPPKPEIRRGKNGHYSDAGLKGASHHGIVPNPNTADRYGDVFETLTPDERKLFDLMARHFIAAHCSDYEYCKTTLALPVFAGKIDLPELLETGNNVIHLKASGLVQTKAGWREVLASTGKKEDQLPYVADGETGYVNDASVIAKKTDPPKRYNEGTLITAMKDAWKFVEDDEEKGVLKEAKGIGTPATRDTIIDGLKRQQLLTLSGKHIVPTPGGLALYKIVDDAAPELNDPAATARMEMRLDDILTGQATGDEVIREIANKAQSHLSRFERLKGQSVLNDQGGAGTTRPATPPMAKLARSIANSKKLKLPCSYKDDFSVCKAFLDKHTTKRQGTGNSTATSSTGENPASEKQVAFIQKLVKQGNSAPVEGWEQSSKIASDYIGKTLKSGKKK